MKNIKAVLFDFDGTIFDTNKLIIDSWNEVCLLYTAKRGSARSVGIKDACDYYAAKLFQNVRKTRRHDRYSQDRRRRVYGHI